MPFFLVSVSKRRKENTKIKVCFQEKLKKNYINKQSLILLFGSLALSREDKGKREKKKQKEMRGRSFQRLHIVPINS